MNRPTAEIRILYVEDDPEFADATATFLEREDARFDVETAPDADRGFERLTEADVDCVVSDFDMPGDNGLELLEEVRRQYPDLPFILFTGKGNEEVASEAISAGVTDYLQKQPGPGQYAVLANRIDHAVSARQSAREIERKHHRFEQLLEAVPASVLQMDADGRFVFANERAKDMLELAPEDPPNQTFEDLEWSLLEMDGEPVAEADRPFEQVWETGRPQYDIRYIVEWPDGRRKTFSINGVPLFDSRGDIETAMFTFADITDLVEHERELEATRARLADHVRTLRRLYEISADREASFDEKLERLLELGLESLGTEAGFLVDVDPGGDRWEVVRAVGEDERLAAGGTAPLSTTYARKVIESGDVLRLDRAGEQGWRDDPAYKKSGYEAYLGSEVYRGDNLYGALCFADRTARESPFTDEAQMFVELATQWLSSALERRRRANELERERNRYTTLFEHLPSPVMHGQLRDSRAIILDANGAFQETFGVDREEVRGKDLHETVLPDDRRDDVDVEALNREVRERGELSTDVRRQATDGVRDFRVDITLRNPEAEVPEGYAIYTDITEHKQYEREQKQRYEAIFDQSFQFTGLMEPDGTLIEANASSLDIVGLDEEEVLGEPFWETPWWQFDAETPDKIREAVERAADGEFVRDELEACSKQGTITVDFSLRPVTDDDGEVRYLIPEGRDITELRALERRERELARQNKRLDRFARVVSHDLRNPLNIASVKLALARRECDSDHLDDLARAHDRMAELIDDVLTLTREGKSVESGQRVDLGELAEATAREMPTGPAIETETAATVRADPVRLRRLLENLFDNAVEHGGPELTIRVGDLPDGFYVQDDGVGIPEEHRDQVLEAGYTTGDEGTGFGLSIVREITEAHDWSVRVTEAADGGARFEFTGVTGRSES